MNKSDAMTRFENLTIRGKLTLLLVGVSSLAALAACLTFSFLIVDRYRQAYTNDLESLAAITGYNCQAALRFDISEDAQRLLDALKQRPSISGATVRDDQGAIFASYGAPAAPGSLQITQPITMNGRRIGEITLHDDMRSIRQFRNMALVSLAAVFALVLCLIWLIAGRLREIIARPISDLAGLARQISEQQDYSLRAPVHGRDELAHLATAFNDMLRQIDSRNHELAGSEQRFRTLVNQAVDIFILHDTNGRLIDANQRACDTLGYSRAELMAMTMADIDSQADNDQYRGKYWSALQPENTLTMEGTFLRRDGMAVPVEIRIGLLELDGAKMVMAWARDITDRIEAEKQRRQMENQLRQSQKMESIGTLAGGIAHDFNNILTPILGYLQLAMSRPRDEHTMREYLTEVLRAAERAKDLVKQILTFSRREAEQLSPVDMRIIAREALKLLRASLPSTIEIRQNLPTDCGAVLANPTQIHQIIMNLCTNAFHAMRDTGGVLAVRLETVRITAEDVIRAIELKPGSYLRLEVSDTGHGMDHATLEKIFEPYFTTKKQGEGTGMGLSVVHGIVKNLGGGISVYSEPGKGSTFHVYLPLLEQPNLQVQQDLAAPLPSGHERVMVVDDEELIRKMSLELLAELGYSAQAFASPVEALEHFRQQPDAFDLVITDMTMPKLTGDRLATEILAIRPDMPVILCTGFSDMIQEDSAKAMGIREYVTKPFTHRHFAVTIRKVLDEKPASSQKDTPPA